VLIEKAGFGLLLLQETQSESAPSRPLPIEVTPKGEKKGRLLGKIGGGQVYLPREAPWLADFLHEVLAFLNGRHDDQVDSMTQFLHWISDDSFPAFSFGLPIYGGPDD
jgi:predicted phage terminase large subunit-like protein